MKAMYKEELIEKIIKSSNLVSKNEKEELLEYWNNKKLYIKKGVFYLGSDKKTYTDMIFELNDEIANLQRENKQLISKLEYIKEFIDTLWLDNKGIVTNIKDKIELIEQGSDSNE